VDDRLDSIAARRIVRACRPIAQLMATTVMTPNGAATVGP
jgi:hypothetical protein